MTINIVILATNIYALLGLRFAKQLNYRYKGDIPMRIHIFTDFDISTLLSESTDNVFVHLTYNDSWVDATNSKFKNIVFIKNLLCINPDDYCYYFDADTSVYTDFTDDFFICDDLVGGEHYNNTWDQEKPFERRIESEAYVPRDTALPQTYFYGAFFGGKSDKVVTLCEKLIEMQQKDRSKGIEPVWNDESFLNKYFHFNRPSKIVPCGVFGKYFGVSDKGGIDDTRDTRKKITPDELALLADNREKIFRLCNGKIVYD